MIKLYIFPTAFGLRNASPFCLKAEMALAFLELDYRIEIVRDPRKAPKGKLPYIDIDGEQIADSELIVEHLDTLTSGGLLGALTPTEKAVGTAVTRLAEDHLYWMIVASRWLDDDWWPHVENAFFGAVPKIVRAIVAPMVRKNIRRTYYLQGLGRHTLEEQKRFARRDLQAINDLVGAHSFVVGERLTVFDFAVAGQLASLLDNRPATWLTTLAGDLPALADYAERVQAATNIYGRELPANPRE